MPVPSDNAVAPDRRAVATRHDAVPGTVPSLAVAAGSEAQRLAAARATIERMRRARRAAAAERPSRPVARVRPRRRASGHAERLARAVPPGLRAAMPGVALIGMAIVSGSAGFVAGRAGTPDRAHASEAAGASVADAAAYAATEANDLVPRSELDELRGQVDALRAALAPEAVAAIADADRDLAMIELGGADPQADRRDVDRARARVRAGLATSIGRAATDAMDLARDDRDDP